MASTRKGIKYATPQQIKAARALLDWSRERLSLESGIPWRTLSRIESGEVEPKVESIAAIYDCLSAAGIRFIEENGGGSGVRFKRPSRKH